MVPLLTFYIHEGGTFSFILFLFVQFSTMNNDIFESMLRFGGNLF